MGVIAEGVRYRNFKDSYKMQVVFEIEDKWLGINNKIPFMIDTGAEQVLLPAADLFISDKQQEIIKKACELKHCTGIVPGQEIDYYRYIVSEFRLGKNIVLKEFPIYITFKKESTIRLVGMSFLKLFNIFIQPTQRSILFTALPFTQKLVSGQSPVRNIDAVFIPEILSADIIDIDEQMAEAHRIHKMILDNEQ